MGKLSRLKIHWFRLTVLYTEVYDFITSLSNINVSVTELSKSGLIFISWKKCSLTSKTFHFLFFFHFQTERIQVILFSFLLNKRNVCIYKYFPHLPNVSLELSFALFFELHVSEFRRIALTIFQFLKIHKFWIHFLLLSWVEFLQI